MNPSSYFKGVDRFTKILRVLLLKINILMGYRVVKVSAPWLISVLAGFFVLLLLFIVFNNGGPANKGFQGVLIVNFHCYLLLFSLLITSIKLYNQTYLDCSLSL